MINIRNQAAYTAEQLSMTDTILKIENISLRIRKKNIVNNVSMRVKRGEFLGIIGANGSGKTTLISMIAGLNKPFSGMVEFDGKKIGLYSRRQLAQKMALVEQHAETTDQMTVRQAVGLGRTPYLSLVNPWSENDSSVVNAILDKIDMKDFCNRNWQTLSGGERKRTHIGRALAQEPELLVMDEPTNHLDVKHQIELLYLIKSLKLTVITSLHDLNHAAMFCDRVAVMQGGALVAIDIPEKIFTPENIKLFFGITAIVESEENNGNCFIRYQYPHC